MVTSASVETNRRNVTVELVVYSDESLGWGGVERFSRGLLTMRNRPFMLVCGIMLMLAMAGPAGAQDKGAQQPSAREQLQRIHTPQSLDQELARLTKDLELTPTQQRQGLP